ncbi:hypothetical protein THAOC_11079 [Thalassiosira oceanica]|uniref:Ribosome recycling factor domain-containing protein n=1 Tax=Thalassiosira oceanica TaxID=159749 RepID=K0SNI5_THAOC|nr:hypothetical protein THAOC_11079 [Thalassiosira oceanica]|eukprot:EJK67833.1 hypothetical protein THAOC_11079 [Thalassiosira oceanica]
MASMGFGVGNALRRGALMSLGRTPLAASSAYPCTERCGGREPASIAAPVFSISNGNSTTRRSFGRKGSRMGHHAKTADEMAYTNAHEEAKGKRQQKKAKSKKARLAADDREIQIQEETDDDLCTAQTRTNSAIRSCRSPPRGGEATPAMFDAIKVSAYGEVVPLNSVGQVVIEDAQRATISCFDPSVANDVRDAVRDMPGLNLNPYLEEGGSGAVIVPIPRVSQETRNEIVKELGRQGENGRQRIRKIRRSAMDVCKKGQAGKLEGVSKDDAFRTGKDVESVTEEVLKVLDEMVKEKQKSVLED